MAIYGMPWIMACLETECDVIYWWCHTLYGDALVRHWWEFVDKCMGQWSWWTSHGIDHFPFLLIIKKLHVRHIIDFSVCHNWLFTNLILIITFITLNLHDKFVAFPNLILPCIQYIEIIISHVFNYLCACDQFEYKCVSYMQFLTFCGRPIVKKLCFKLW